MGLFGGKAKADRDDRDDEQDEREAAREAKRAARKERQANKNNKKGGKNKKSKSSDSDGKKSDVKVGANSRRKDESIIHETVFDTAVSTMKQNKPFRVRRDDEDMFVGVLMRFSDIGGLSKKDMRDESKGQIITQINSGGIASVFTSELKAKDQIVFIPNMDTLSQMGEFSILADDLEYELVLVIPDDESVEETGVKVDLEYLINVHKKGFKVTDKLARALEPTVSKGEPGYSDLPASPPAASEPVSDGSLDLGFESAPEPASSELPEESFGPESFGIGGEDGDSGSEPEDEFGGDSSPFDGDDDGEGFGSLPAGEDDGSDGSEEPEESEEPGEVPGSVGVPEMPMYVGPEVSARALSRKFFNDDMAKELSTAGVDQAIAGVGQFQPLLMRPEDTWLNQQLNAMIDMANKEMYALHQKNVDIVRNAYLNAIGSAYIAEMGRVSDYESDERYNEIQAQVSKESERLDEIIQEEREKLKADWEAKLKRAGEAGYATAEQTYRERHQFQYEERLRNIDGEVRAGLQAAENTAIANLKSARKREAQIRLDELDSKQIEVAVAKYHELLVSETELYAKHEQAILQFLEENRAAEIARVSVLGSELERDDKITQIQKEYASKVDAMRADFDARIMSLQADIDANRLRHERDIADKDARYNELQAKYDKEKGEWRDQIKELTDEVVRVNDSKTREVETRVGEMRAERDSYSQKYEHLVKTQKSSSMLMLALAFVAALAALMVGIVIGGFVLNKSDGDKAPDTPPAIVDTNPDLSGDAGGVADSENGDDGTGQGVGDAGNQSEGQPSGQDSSGSPSTPSDTGSSEDPAWAALQDPVI